MKVLVAGGTGFIGRHLCRELADRDHEVTALARTPDKQGLPDEVTVAEGDVTDAETMRSAIAGHEAVVNLVSLSPLFEPPGGNERHDAIHRVGTQHCVQAAASADVDRFLQVSALGADPDGPTHYIRAKGAAETLVRNATVDWTIVRPSVVFGEGAEFLDFTKQLKRWFAPGLPFYPLPGGGSTRFQPIHVAELVAMMAEMLDEEEHANEVYELGGPEVLTLREVTEMVYAAEEKDIRIVSLPMSLARVGLRVLGAVPGFPMGPDQYRSLQFDNTTTTNDIGVFGYSEDDLTTLGEFLGIGDGNVG